MVSGLLYLYSNGRFQMLAIRLPESIEKRLARLAKRSGRTKTFYAREAILRYIEDLEDVYDAERAWERIQSGKDKTIPMEDVLKRYGLDG
jgi:RHH-type rel operon transcriptional repressor/antitoxin RelB